MLLPAGTRVGSYEVIGPLGAGGMGEVLRARDTRLPRDVALKVLRGDGASDPERLKRFEQEARALAALQSPHIVTMYDLLSHDGVSVVVTELLAGRTLRAELDAAPARRLPVRRVAAIARQVAEGLAAAHDKGVVHRDLKPENVFVTSDGLVKILDYGLAKACGPAEGTPLGARDVTTTATGVGTIVGTVGYMAPEQVRSEAVDHRADIFALGVMLHEMASGTRPFGRGTSVETLSAILQDEAPELSSVVPDVAVELARVVRRCLEKRPSDRFQSARDLAFQLAAFEHPTATSHDPVDRAPRTRWRPMPWAGWAAAVVALALLAWRTAGDAGAPPITADRAPTHLSIVLGGGERLIYEGNGSANLAISPDGRRIVYVAEKAGVRQVYARNLGQSESQPIAGTEGANTRLPFFAPDGQWVGFFGGGLRKVPVAGGQAVLVTPVGSNSDTGSAQWLDDGSIVFSNGMGTTLRRVSATGGPVTEITKFDGAESWWGHLWPDVLPGNRHVLFTIVPPDDDIERTVVVVQSLETGERRELLRGARFARYRFGHLVYERRGQYFAVPFDPASLAVGSKATVVLDKTWWGRMAVSTLGAMVYRPGGDSALQGLVWVDRSGREESVTGPPLLLAGEVALSPDGKTAAVAAGDLNHFLWLVDTTRGTARRLTSDLHSHDPVWMPDGQSMIFTGNKAGVRQNLRRLWLDRRDESEPGALRAQDDVLQSGATVHPDGHTVAFVSGATPPFDIYTFDLNRTDRPRPLLATRVSEAGPSFSPNGRWLAYTSDESGRTEVYVARWPDLGGQQFVSTEGGAEPLWSKDGRELAYRWAGVVHAVSFDPARGTVGTPERLFAGYPQLNAFQGIDLAPDGRFIVTKQAPSADTSLHVVLNWDIELRRLTKQ